MFNDDLIYCWKVDLHPELLWRLVCTGATTLAELVPMGKLADGSLVAANESILLELGDFAVEYMNRDEDFPVELRAKVMSGGDAAAINGMLLDQSFVTMRYNPIQKIAVVSDFGRFDSVSFAIPSECPTTEKGEQIRANFLRSLGIKPVDNEPKGAVAVTGRARGTILR